jgi:hypothetical protein
VKFETRESSSKCSHKKRNRERKKENKKRVLAPCGLEESGILMETIPTFGHLRCQKLCFGSSLLLQETFQHNWRDPPGEAALHLRYRPRHWLEMVSFIPRPFYPLCPLDKRLGGPKFRSGQYELLSPPAIEPQPSSPSSSLYRLSYHDS